jgi:hypothetical protein
MRLRNGSSWNACVTSQRPCWPKFYIEFQRGVYVPTQNANASIFGITIATLLIQTELSILLFAVVFGGIRGRNLKADYAV